MLAYDPSPWLAVFGRAHPVLLHLPIGLLVGTATLEFGAALLRREPPRGAVRALCALGAITALLSVGSGLVLAGERGSGWTIETHKFAAFAQAALMLLAALAAWKPSRGPLRVVLALALAAMTVAGHTGGSMVHGSDFLLAPLQPKPAAAEPLPSATPDSPYTALVAPILERTCAKCHRPDKAKGGLVLTTADGLRAGGETGPAFVAGKPDASLLLTRCLLPLADDDHMPPNDEPQPTAAELQTLRLWLLAGAPF